jgi:fluoride ion exporter CrcB/FEX
MKGKWLIAARSSVSLGVGGAVGAVLPYLQSMLATHDIEHIDLHRVAIDAVASALIAIFFHWTPPPTKGVTPPPTVTIVTK